MMDLAQKHRPNIRIVAASDLIPHFPIRVTKPAIRAQTSRVQKSKGWAVEYRCLRGIGRALCSFCAVKADLGVCAVAERRLMRVTASTQSVLGRGVINLAFLPMQ